MQYVLICMGNGTGLKAVYGPFDSQGAAHQWYLFHSEPCSHYIIKVTEPK